MAGCEDREDEGCRLQRLSRKPHRSTQCSRRPVRSIIALSNVMVFLTHIMLLLRNYDSSILTYEMLDVVNFIDYDTPHNVHSSLFD